MKEQDQYPYELYVIDLTFSERNDKNYNPNYEYHTSCVFSPNEFLTIGEYNNNIILDVFTEIGGSLKAYWATEKTLEKDVKRVIRAKRIFELNGQFSLLLKDINNIFHIRFYEIEYKNTNPVGFGTGPI